MLRPDRGIARVYLHRAPVDMRKQIDGLVVFSIVETAKGNGIEPHAYLSLLFAQLPYAKTVEDFEALLPWRVRTALTPAPLRGSPRRRPWSGSRAANG